MTIFAFFLFNSIGSKQFLSFTNFISVCQSTVDSLYSGCLLQILSSLFKVFLSFTLTFYTCRTILLNQYCGWFDDHHHEESWWWWVPATFFQSLSWESLDFFLKDLIIFKDTLRFSKDVSNIFKGIPKLSSYHLQYFQLENSKDISDLK